MGFHTDLTRKMQAVKILSAAAFLVAQMFATAEGFSLQGHAGSFVGLPRKTISQFSSSPLLRLVENMCASFFAAF
jgi:hypothetical protein